MLKAEDIAKKIGKKTLIENITYTFEKGLYVLVGPNGSGKTTLLRCLAGVYSCDKGKVRRDANMIGYLPQTMDFFGELTVNENMEYFSLLKKIEKKKQKEEIARCLEAVNLSNEKDERVALLSGGTLRRLGIAQALMGKPSLIFLDEPMAGLDINEKMELYKILKRMKTDCSIIMSVHDISNIETLCDTIILMKDGRIHRSFTPEELKNCAKASETNDKRVEPTIEDGYLYIMSQL